MAKQLSLTRKAVLKAPNSGFKSQPCFISSVLPNVEWGEKLWPPRRVYGREALWRQGVGSSAQCRKTLGRHDLLTFLRLK